jgi:hypothetical protein
LQGVVAGQQGALKEGVEQVATVHLLEQAVVVLLPNHH